MTEVSLCSTKFECDLSFNVVDIINTIMKEPKKKTSRPIKIKSKEEL